MANKKYCQVMAEYNRWMNAKLYEACGTVSDENRKKDRKAFFKSIHGTLNHLLWGDRAWLRRFTGKEYALTKPGEDLYEDFHSLRAEREKMDRDIINWVSGLNEEWFSGSISFESIIYKKTITLPAMVAVMQMFNHQTHHRGQITTLLSQLGVDYGVTDLPVMPGVVQIVVS